MPEAASTNHRIKHLTTEEIQTLQVDAALRLLAEHTVHLTTLNNELASALQKEAQSRCDTLQLRHAKSTIINNMRALETIARSA